MVTPSSLDLSNIPTYPAGVTNPYGVAVGDLSGDGRSDLIVLSGKGTAFSVLLANNHGGFFGPNDVCDRRDGMPQVLAVGDFNADGKLRHVAVADYFNFIAVLLGNGSGGFSPPITSFMPANGTGIVVGDFNRDGKMDLAVASHPGDQVSVLLGNGSGSFSAPRKFLAAGRSEFLGIGRFQRRGMPDIAVVNNNSTAPSVGVLLGDGTGNFSAATTYDCGGEFPVHLLPPTSMEMEEPILPVATPIAAATSRCCWPMRTVVSSRAGHVLGTGCFRCDGGFRRWMGLDLVAVDVFGSADLFFGDGTGQFGPKTVFSRYAGRNYDRGHRRLQR